MRSILWIRLAFRQVFPKGVTGVISTQHQDEVAASRDVVREFNCNEDDGDERGPQALVHAPMHSDDDEDGPRALAHAPIHDAESVFWLIVLFFLRAWPKGYNLDPNVESGVVKSSPHGGLQKHPPKRRRFFLNSKASRK
ncbi:hypothetical protein AX14_005135 [Amanita brunnescens Koide BX004]|nr:hypothetical protein AX14_005135 [Amanita brunnescens Koide BX004]